MLGPAEDLLRRLAVRNSPAADALHAARRVRDQFRRRADAGEVGAEEPLVLEGGEEAATLFHRELEFREDCRAPLIFFLTGLPRTTSNSTAQPITTFRTWMASLIVVPEYGRLAQAAVQPWGFCSRPRFGHHPSEIIAPRSAFSTRDVGSFIGTSPSLGRR